jgi:hypothetical protein
MGMRLLNDQIGFSRGSATTIGRVGVRVDWSFLSKPNEDVPISKYLPYGWLNGRKGGRSWSFRGE